VGANPPNSPLAAIPMLMPRPAEIRANPALKLCTPFPISGPMNTSGSKATPPNPVQRDTPATKAPHSGIPAHTRATPAAAIASEIAWLLATAPVSTSRGAQAAKNPAPLREDPSASPICPAATAIMAPAMTLRARPPPAKANHFVIRGNSVPPSCLAASLVIPPSPKNPTPTPSVAAARAMSASINIEAISFDCFEASGIAWPYRVCTVFTRLVAWPR
jgi:hypothetical protein